LFLLHSVPSYVPYSKLFGLQMNRLEQKNCLLVVTGSIAAYKTPELVRRIIEAGGSVRVVMTSSAEQFVTALTLQAVSGFEVRSDMFDAKAEAAMGHIELARWADAIVVAPATADYIAKLRTGHANDLGNAICLASDAPVLIAPAMNQKMWTDPSVGENLEVLKSRGMSVIGPGSGSQACGDIGLGRLVEPEVIVSAVSALFERGILAGLEVMVTAGPTREHIDPVRYITNHSSGKMGFALARAATEAGARVVLVSGPTMLAPLPGIKTINVVSSGEMRGAVSSNIKSADIFIATAAVADYRPEKNALSKVKRGTDVLNMRLVPNVDILAEVAALNDAPFTVGFAAETEKLELFAAEKLKRKKIDMIAANLVGEPGRGFDSDYNELTVFWDKGGKKLQHQSKQQLARELVKLVAIRYDLFASSR
jgi:phosphopantothenoylcysteine decarboxylase/phosphopantothenate--cysteine ligase